MPTERTKTAESRAWAWDQYWRDGRLASCGGAGGAGYQAAIADGWRAFFLGLPEGSRILDVCAGNGAIARLAEETAAERGIRYTIEAVDAARLAPPDIGAGGMIRFRPRIAIEDLPCPDDAFDVVVGQYAIEYTDMARSLPELARVSSDASRLRFVTHAREGVTVEGARRQLAEVDQLRESRIFAAAKALAEANAGPAPSRESMSRLQQRYREANRRLAQAAENSVEPEMFTNTAKVIQHALSVQHRAGVQPVIDKISEVANTVKAHATRLEAMTEAAIDEAGAHRLAQRIGKLWRQRLWVEACLREDKALLGWTIESAATPRP